MCRFGLFVFGWWSGWSAGGLVVAAWVDGQVSQEHVADQEFPTTTAGCCRAVAWLIEHKADVNLKDKQGRTALREALERDKAECARLLRKAGAQ